MVEFAQFARNSDPPVAASLWLSILLFLTAVNAPLRRGRVKSERVSFTFVFVAVVALAWWSGPLLRALDVSAPNWRIATALVLIVAAIVDLVGARVEPIVMRPELGALAIQTGRDHGVAGAVLAIALGLASLALWHRENKWFGRGVALAQVALAVALLLDGVLAI